VNEMERRADETFTALRSDFPDSPLGWAGAADLRLKQAEERDLLGIQRFENRARRREALELYVEARGRSGDPALLAGYGMALSGLGRHEEARRALTQLHELFPNDPAYEALLVRALQRAGRPRQVVEALAPRLSTDTSERTSLRMTPQTFGFWEPQLFTYGAAGSRASWVLDLSNQENAGASVTDLGFLPEANGVWFDVWCPQVNLIGAQIQIGAAAEAWAAYRRGERISPSTCANPEDVAVELLPRLAGVAATASGDERLRQEAVTDLVDEYLDDVTARSILWDDLQNFWRSVGEWHGAREVLDRWAEELPIDPWAVHRRGEVAFLSQDYEEAVEYYTEAAPLFLAAYGADWGDHGYRDLSLTDEGGEYLNALELGAALEYSGREAEAVRAYERADGGARNVGTQNVEFVWFYATSQLGGLALAAGDYEAAVSRYKSLLEWSYRGRVPAPGDDVEATSALHGAQENNLALALLKLGRHKAALRYALAALSYDRANPVFVDTVAFVQQFGGDDQAAVESYESVLAVDDSAYVSANNLAVLMAQRGQRSMAVELLTNALRAAPSYALGWHNLGVLNESFATKLLESQGARARAATLDRRFRGEDGLLVDEEIYESGLDVSRPLSPDWTYAETASRSPVGLTISALVLLLLRLVWRLGLDKVFDAVGQRIMKLPRRSAVAGRARWFWGRLGGAVAVVASVAALGWPTLAAAHSWPERAVLGGAVVAMVSLPIFVRRLAAGREPIRHFTWVPALAVGAAGAPFGFAFAPYPVLDTESRTVAGPGSPSEARLRWLVPAVVSAVALPFIILALVDPVPLTRLLALAATALLASVLAPVPPLDGAYLKHRFLDLGATILFTLTTIAFAVRWI
jgi:tetratricopeptide (TPR) repeat protein